MPEIKKDENCIFCKIIKGIIPSYKVFEDEDVLAFLTIGPINEGHTLIIPKNHIVNFYEMEEFINTKVFSTAKKIAEKISQTLNPQKVGLLVAGWDVPHTHIHVVPMNEYHE